MYCGECVVVGCRVSVVACGCRRIVRGFVHFVVAVTDSVCCVVNTCGCGCV